MNEMEKSCPTAANAAQTLIEAMYLLSMLLGLALAVFTA